MAIQQNRALYSVLGTNFGGDGISTFGLPDLRGRAPLGFGQGNGLSNYPLGALAGAEDVSLSTSTIPPHTHLAQSTGGKGQGNTTDPADAVWARNNEGDTPYATTADSTMSSQAIFPGPSNGPVPHNNMQPFLVLYFIIALEGVPPRP